MSNCSRRMTNHELLRELQRFAEEKFAQITITPGLLLFWIHRIDRWQREYMRAFGRVSRWDSSAPIHLSKNIFTHHITSHHSFTIATKTTTPSIWLKVKYRYSFYNRVERTFSKHQSGREHRIIIRCGFGDEDEICKPINPPLFLTERISESLGCEHICGICRHPSSCSDCSIFYNSEGVLKENVPFYPDQFTHRSERLWTKSFPETQQPGENIAFDTAAFIFDRYWRE